jgi:lipoprotein-anchoring transpeptidase ErfK/SrfK
VTFRPLATLVVVAAVGACPAAAVALDRKPAGVARQQLAAVRDDTAVYAAPSTRAPLLGTLASTRPITGERTTLPIEASARADGRTWLRVLLPGRPNGRRGWIVATSATVSGTPWRLLVELGLRRLSVFQDGRLVRTFSAIVGRPSTPTPVGSFFVEETVQLPASAPGAPYALALSARSNAYTEFDGGPGQIAIHGIDNIGGTLGEALSHGCVRLSTGSISWLAARIGPGVPVEIAA